MKNEIQLKQYPIITHKLQEAGKRVQERLDSLELDKQVFTEETVKSFKVLRAELNKELADFEAQRKAIKEGVNNPYLEFESVYKEEITERYKKAIDACKNGIDTVEFRIKKDKENNVKEYFDELCQAENIDFIKFEKLGIEVNLSTTEKKYKEQVYEFIAKVNDDLALIKATDYEAETMAEYKKTLNVSNAITTVKTRKESEAAEQAKIKAEQRQNREKYLSKLGLNYVEITNSWEYNADIYVTLSDIINLSKEDFTAKYAEVEAKISVIKEENAKQIEVVETPVNGTEPIFNAPIEKPKVSAPISAPKVETPTEPDSIAQFEVKAPMSKLRLLGQYMKDNGIAYKNI